MPGMMETVLNVGLTSKTIPRLVARSGSERFAYDSYRRLIMMYADVVMEKALGLNKSNTEVRIKMERLLKEMKKKKKYKDDSSVSAKHWKELSFKYLALIKKDFGVEFPDDPYSQLFGAIEAVFSSWNGKRAQEYRAFENIPDAMGTAVSVQAMVFGNLGEGCGTGVAFTRNPSTGENKFYGEWLQNAQGEDVVAGIRTPHPILAESGLKNSLEKTMPAAFLELDRTRKQLEKHFDDMQDIEFTIQDHKLWMLQTRTGKRTGIAAVKIATDMVGERLISKKTALSRVRPNQIYESLLKNIEPDSLVEARVLGAGLPAGPGASCGAVVFSAEKAEELGRAGKSVILVREETSPEDIRGMHYSDGILTSRGGLTSHAALVARGWGKSCVVGCQTLHINKNMLSGSVGDTKIKEGDWITLSGSTGEIFKGRLPLFQNPLSRSGPLNELLSWADHTRKLKIRTNADTPEDCKKALDFGAEGIGLCRTEHMFFDEKRILAMRKMILSENDENRREAVMGLLPFQKEDFKEILKAMEGKPVTIRLLDPPLHEFITLDDNQITELANNIGIDRSVISQRIASLHELNPMLGHRGCRLGIAYPAITEMQARAILEATAELLNEDVNVLPEIMIPLIGTVTEYIDQEKIIRNVASEVENKFNLKLNYLVGTMIELPRACLTADEIAEHAEFFSFGTNDLTQTTYGFSRDDIGSFLPEYLDRKILPGDPFQSLDVKGVGKLVTMAVQYGRKVNPSLKIGICGEHGGDPDSVHFCRNNGLDYVSCSPYRVPIARLSAAQAELI